MTFDELSDGEAIFLDANIFVYHFLGLSQQCKQLLKRCRDGLLQGRTASFIVAETAHRLMVAEAVEQKLVTSKNAVKKLREASMGRPLRERDPGRAGRPRPQFICGGLYPRRLHRIPEICPGFLRQGRRSA